MALSVSPQASGQALQGITEVRKELMLPPQPLFSPSSEAVGVGEE